MLPEVDGTRCVIHYNQDGEITSINGNFRTINNLNTTMVTNMGFMFDGCSQLTSIDLKGFSTINVTKMQGMFFGCSSLASLNLCRFNTSNVTNMNVMFRNCSNLRTIYVTVQKVGDGFRPVPGTDATRRRTRR